MTTRIRSTADGPSPGRRGFLLGAVGATPVLSGCSSGDDGTGGGVEKSGDPDTTAQAAAGGFPATVSGKEGAAKVTSPPKRFAACGYLRDTDLALALPFETIAAARPDLILASDDYQLHDHYPKFQRLAPTLSYRKGVGQDGWDEMAQPTGDVLGKREKADSLVADVRKKIADVREQHPELRGKTFTFGPVVGGDVFTIKSADDAGAQFFSQLGMKLSPKVTSLPDSAIAGRAAIARERLDLLDADVVILAFDTPQGREEFEAQPLFKELKAVRRKSYIGLDMPTAIALGFPSVLSLPYGLDAVVPKLAEAAERNA
ncbi:ABC transporter substrate-binding protein [Streptomyces pseudovenezuelae]|uniref:Iron complex transport system substrate-binding protein n=1 Tax=Streptomyces pseudovenezuelae TaxID=67350 RepID=A0ABT6LDF5_9ACTN|nr:ABC transporter substrate-binding protein [Streptomyces pseudovenezuelae]MDH6214344.1 iron complex transport system substrate-binding protein [Streptomyces pseudovenezuelae]